MTGSRPFDHLRALARTPTFRLLGLGIGVIAALAVAYGIAWWAGLGAFPGDTLTYYLAGLRLNTGHLLYDLQPGDIWLYARPEFPLLGPPLIAVLWRPLAALPAASGMIAWLIAMYFLAVLAVIYSLLGTRGWAGIVVLALVPSLTLLTGVGNLDALVLACLFLTWWLLATGRDRAAGLLIGFLASIKLTPAVLIVWLIVSGRWRALRWAIAAGLVLAVVAMVGTEPGIWLRYLRVVQEASGVGREGALLVIPVGFALLLLLRRWPRVTFGLSIALIPLASPFTGGHTWSLLLAILAPWIVASTGPQSGLRSPAGGNGAPAAAAPSRAEDGPAADLP